MIMSHKTIQMNAVAAIRKAAHALANAPMVSIDEMRATERMSESGGVSADTSDPQGFCGALASPVLADTNNGPLIVSGVQGFVASAMGRPTTAPLNNTLRPMGLGGLDDIVADHLFNPFVTNDPVVENVECAGDEDVPPLTASALLTGLADRVESVVEGRRSEPIIDGGDLYGDKGKSLGLIDVCGLWRSAAESVADNLPENQLEANSTLVDHVDAVIEEAEALECRRSESLDQMTWRERREAEMEEHGYGH